MSDFGAELERLMRARGLGVRALHRRSGYSAGYITQLRQGRRNPSPETARDLDDALDAGGALAARVHAPSMRAKSAEPAVFGPVPEPGLLEAAGDALAAALTELDGAGQQEPVLDIGALAASVDAARAHYQDCRYTQLAGSLAGLLKTLKASCAALDGDGRDRARALSADAHHVAAGLMLKRGDLGLATLAADRSMRAALASGDPVAVAASARIITHALMSGGHLAAAVATATSYASRLDLDLPGQTPESLSVYGALLLRGAVAAAQGDDRRTAGELLGEAEEAARRLGRDGNYCWTAFGPVNAAVHRVSIAVTLGDAGTAIDAARAIPVGAISVTERKATLLIDTARAFLQRGRHENAYRALRAAHQAAPEEVTGRAAIRDLVRDLAATAPVTVRRDASQFAASIGATA
jgi:transcriptional regulator with XRE-family HTH domain